jgi:hypothetical protein
LKNLENKIWSKMKFLWSAPQALLAGGYSRQMVFCPCSIQNRAGILSMILFVPGRLYIRLVRARNQMSQKSKQSNLREKFIREEKIVTFTKMAAFFTFFVKNVTFHIENHA